MNEDAVLDAVMYRARGPIRSYDDLQQPARGEALTLIDWISVGHWPEDLLDVMQWHRAAEAERHRRRALEMEPAP